mgnify:CR=1 FL=1
MALRIFVVDFQGGVQGDVEGGGLFEGDVGGSVPGLLVVADAGDF